MNKVTEEQNQLEKKWQMLNVMKSRKALGGDAPPKIASIKSPQLSHFMMRNPQNKNASTQDNSSTERFEVGVRMLTQSMIESTGGRANHEELNQIGESAMTKIFGGSQILQPDFIDGNETTKLAQIQISGRQ